MVSIKKVGSAIQLIAVMVGLIGGLEIKLAIDMNDALGLFVGLMLFVEFFLLLLIGRETSLYHSHEGYVRKIQKYMKFAAVGVGIIGLAFIVFNWSSNWALFLMGIFLIVIAAIIEEILVKYTPNRK